MAISIEEGRLRDREAHKRAREKLRHPFPCEGCGTEFLRIGIKQRFCSKACYKNTHRDYLRDWKKKKPKSYHTRIWLIDRCRKLGMTIHEYDTLKEKQGGLCAICNKRPLKDLDHNHKTGKFRGLLCGLCNRGLGQFQDDVETLLAAAAYIKRTEQQ